MSSIMNQEEEFECPYCLKTRPSARELRRHVGAEHRDKVDDFARNYHGGRIIPPRERS